MTACGAPESGGWPLLHEMVAAQARARPDSTALVFDGGAWTYAGLASRADRLARRLRACGVGPEVLVGLCLDRSPLAVVGMLGVLQAGGAFLPLDPAYPPERLELMLDDARPAVVLVDAMSAPALPPHGGRTIRIETALSGPGPPMGDLARIGPGTLAYVIYTSGSTGRPKGVMVEHRGIVNLARAQINLFGVEPASRVLQFASLNFDAAIAEIAVALCAGASLHVAPRERLLPVEPLARLMGERDITHATLPPSLLALLPTSALPAGLTLILAGEPSGAALVARWAPGRRLLNAYGPTEATVCATVGPCAADGAPPPIGRPIDNVEVLILDKAGLPVPIGAAGEIHIGGIGVARGYLARPELTAERFATVAGKRVYRTGDLGRWRQDGGIDFLGRVDRQIKIRGHRIEPEEIEATLARHPSVESAVVVGHDSGMGAQLAAYVVGPVGRRPQAAHLRRYLSECLPGWMVPTHITALDAFPVSPNGKVARDRLPEPGGPEREDGGPFLPPRDSLELVLAVAVQELLGTDRLGIRDDFFQLGGDSLLALRLAARIEAATGRRLPLAALANGATVERLAVALRELGGGMRWSPVVPLATGGRGPPLLCVHPAGGSVLVYADLARALAGMMPVYGLQAQGFEPGQAALDRVADMAEAYIAAVRSELRPAVWRLAGWSFGAVVAFEMACRLSITGEAVASPIILDAPVRHAHGDAGEVDIVQRVIRMYGDMLGIDPNVALEIGTTGQDRLAWMVERAVASGIFPSDFSVAQARRLAAVIAGCFHAGQTYLPSGVFGRMTLIRAADNPMEANDPLLGWGRLAADQVDLRWVAGTHTTMLRPPSVDRLAAAICDCLAVEPGPWPKGELGTQA